jgi:RNA polymerase sigma factor (sigma-70 family)
MTRGVKNPGWKKGDVTEEDSMRYFDLAKYPAIEVKRMLRSRLIYEKEDLIHEAYVEGNWWRYVEQSNGYLRTIIKFDMIKCVGRWTHRHHNGRNTITMTPLSFIHDDEGNQIDFEGNERDPADVAEINDMVSFILEESGLTPGEKKAIETSYLRGLTPTEAARERGLTDGAIHTQCYNAKLKIREALNHV